MNFAGVQSITIPEGDVKSIAIGGVTVWQKPNPLPYDAEVEYVESTGAQYVDTGVAAAGDIRVVLDAQLRSDSNLGSTPGLFGTVTTLRFCLLVAHSNRNWEASYNNSYSSSTVAADFDRHEFDVSNVFKLDGVTLWSRSVAQFSFENIYLFAIRRAAPQTVRNFSKMKLFSAKLYKAGVLVHAFQPVRVGTVGYLYDRANPTGGPLGNGLYGSATSTPLVAGPDKNGG